VLYKNDKKCYYALEGAVESAGRALNWLKNNMKIFNDFNELSSLFNSVEDNGDVYFVPSFSGLFSPYWDESARGLILGLTTFTERGHIVRSIFEAICYRSTEIINSIVKDSSIMVKSLKVDGGMTNSSEFLQTQADIAQIQVVKHTELNITSIGAAIAAGLSPFVKAWNGFEELKNLILVDKIFNPKWNKIDLEKKFNKWEKAVSRSKSWVD